MDKKEILKQLENIQSLMACDIFELNIEIKGYDNSDMYVGLTKAIKQIKKGK